MPMLQLARYSTPSTPHHREVSPDLWDPLTCPTRATRDATAKRRQVELIGGVIWAFFARAGASGNGDRVVRSWSSPEARRLNGWRRNWRTPA